MLFNLAAIETELAGVPWAGATPPPAPDIGEPPDTERDAFPLDALPAPLGAMAEHAARQTSAPVSLCAAAGLGVVAASIGSGLFVQSSPAGLTPANLFQLCFADSGTGKGQAFNAMLAAYYTEGQRRAEDWEANVRPDLAADLEAAKSDLEAGKKDRKAASEPEGKASALEAIRDATRRIQEAETDLAKAPVFNVGNATAEAIADTLANAPGEAAPLFSAEARDVVDNLLGRYSKGGASSDEPIFLQSYSGDPVTHRRKGRPEIDLKAPRLTLCLAAQPDIWDRLAGDGRMMESGFLARCLTFDAKARPARPSGHIIPPAVSAAWAARVVELLDLREAPAPARIVNPTPDARSIIEALANEAADAREPGGKWAEVKPFAARLAENTWRLALCLHAARHGKAAPLHELTAGTAAAAVALARWFFAETLSLLAPTTAKRQTARLERLLDVFQGKRVTEITLRELRKNHGFDEPELKQLAAAFPARFRVVRCSPTGTQGGRPSDAGQIQPFRT